MENVKDPSIYKNPVILQSEDLTKVSIQIYLENLIPFFLNYLENSLMTHNEQLCCSIYWILLFTLESQSLSKSWGKPLRIILG